MSEFVGGATDEQKQRAMEFVQPDRTEYLDYARVNKTQGSVEVVNGEQVTGWARYIYGTQPARDELIVNGEVIAGQVADQARDGATDDDVSRSTGFQFDLRETVELQQGDEVRVRVEDDVLDVENSPWTYVPS